MPTLTVLTYHRLGVKHGDTQFDECVIDASLAEFEEQIAEVRRHFRVISTAELAAYLDGKAHLPPNAAMITFDDGYRECHQLALPLLLRYGLRAVFFVATDYVGRRRVFWWDRLSYLVKHSAHSRFRIDYPRPREWSLASAADRYAAKEGLIRIVKDHTGLDVERFLDEVGNALGVPWTPTLELELAEELVMNWDQVRALHKAGMEVQSHTRSHRLLDTLSPSELATELEGSRTDLEAQLDAPVRAIAYPAGRGVRGDDSLAEAVRAAGYDVGFSSNTGINVLDGTLLRFDVRRVAIEAKMPLAYLRASIALPFLAHPRRTTRPHDGAPALVSAEARKI
jgi:peptidoglycan/xylan/chitin deacetylase (PgdA/CDA1 family)